MFRSLVSHFVRSVRFYRLTALYLIAGIALATAHIPFKQSLPAATKQGCADPAASWRQTLARFQLDIGEPPVSIGHITYYIIAGWISFLGAFWDVRRRMKEWAIIRLCGGHPSLVAGFHFFFLSLLGALIGGGIAFLFGPSNSLIGAAWLVTATLVWGFFFSAFVSAGPIVYTEFFDVVAVLRIEGVAR